MYWGIKRLINQIVCKSLYLFTWNSLWFYSSCLLWQNSVDKVHYRFGITSNHRESIRIVKESHYIQNRLRVGTRNVKFSPNQRGFNGDSYHVWCHNFLVTTHYSPHQFCCLVFMGACRFGITSHVRNSNKDNVMLSTR